LDKAQDDLHSEPFRLKYKEKSRRNGRDFSIVCHPRTKDASILTSQGIDGAALEGISGSVT